MMGMKFASPFQRGTMCWWRWAAIPAPATSPWFIPRLNPWGRLTERTTLMAVAVSSPISWRSAGVASVQSEMCR